MNTNTTDKDVIQDFLDSFIAEYWQKGPGKFSYPGTSPLATIEDVSQVLMGAGDCWRTGVEQVNFGMWVDRAFQMDKYPSLFATREDGDFDTYIKRVTGSSGGKEFCYVQYNAQAYAHDMWERALSFLSQLFQKVGMPYGEVDMDLFLGDYESTPRGIHTDSADTFMYIVKGHKKILLWAEDYFDDKEVPISGKSPQRTLVGVDHTPFMDDAIVLDGRPGDFFYWPASSWHIGVNDMSVGPSVAVNMGVFLHLPKDALLTNTLEELLEPILVAPSFTSNPMEGNQLTQESHVLPLKEHRGIELLKALCSNGQIENLVHTQWLRRVSALGFHSVPPPSNAKLLPTKILRLKNSHIPIIWHRFSDGVIVCGKGQCARFDYCEELISFLKDINAGNIIQLSEESAANTIEAMSCLLKWRLIVQ